MDETVEAENDRAALESFSESYDAGQLNEKEGPGFHDPNFLLITFEEVGEDVTKVNIGETSAGVKMGTASVGTG